MDWDLICIARPKCLFISRMIDYSYLCDTVAFRREEYFFFRIAVKLFFIMVCAQFITLRTTGGKHVSTRN